MEAGRELDAEIATHVFGWKLVDYGVEDQQWFQPWQEGWAGPAVLPPFSTNIAAAWHIVEKMNTLDWYCELTSVPCEYICEFYKTDAVGDKTIYHLQYSDSTPMLAICLAALRAVEG